MLEARNVTREFPGVKALDDVSVRFEKGEVHALMGENGAGKSTLMKIITGIYRPDAGAVYVDGEKAALRSYSDSAKYDISIVHQEIQVIPESSVAENIVLDKLGQFRGPLGGLDWKRINDTAQRYLDMVELDVKPTDAIGRMTAAQKQLIQIAKALSSDARYILMDEPTSSLTQYEAQNLFRIIRRLKAEDRCVIFVSHKIEEVLEICDRVTVLRDGRVIGTRDVADIDRDELVRMMIGRSENIEHLGRLDISDEVVLEARHICRSGVFEDMNLKLHRGEILGLYGLVGAGRTEFARLLVGADRRDTGDILIKGQPAKIDCLRDAVEKYGLGYVTENRKEEGLILPFNVRDNMVLPILRKLRDKPFHISPRRCKDVTREMIGRMNVKAPSQETRVESLSGGNQQKVSIGKWLAAGCDILIIDEPTVGVDVGAKRQIHELIWDLAKNEGKSIILISSDMTEMITLARRILAFKNYKIVSEIDHLNDREYSYAEVSERIGAAMT